MGGTLSPEYSDTGPVSESRSELSGVSHGIPDEEANAGTAEQTTTTAATSTAFLKTSLFMAHFCLKLKRVLLADESNLLTTLFIFC